MSEEKPKLGAPRKGPYAGKTRSLATKLTEDTMIRLTAAAKSSEMSISQMTEVALVRGLDAMDDFQRLFGMPLRRFEEGMVRAMPPRDASADLSEWSRSAKRMIRLLTDELARSVDEVCAGEGVSKPEVLAAPASPKQASSRIPPSKGPSKRILDVADDQP